MAVDGVNDESDRLAKVAGVASREGGLLGDAVGSIVHVKGTGLNVAGIGASPLNMRSGARRFLA
jgi:hypothetical protein